MENCYICSTEKENVVNLNSLQMVIVGKNLL